MLYIFYEKQNRSDEFIFFLSFVNSLTAESIQNLIEQYKKDKNLLISVANSDSDEVYSFTKLLYFMEGINRAQRLQLKTVFKSIQANWDSTQILAFTKENKDDILVTAGVLKEGEFKLISVGSHLIALHRTSDGTFIYDPNSLKGPILCRMDEYDLEQMITPYFSPEGHIILSVFDISYGDINRELDDIIATFKEVIQADEIMQSVYLHYQAGKISRTDLAYCLQTQLNDIINDAKFGHNEKMHELYLKINMYLETKQERNIISPEFGSVDKTHSKANLLYTACRYGKLDLVKHLITNCGADINNQDNLGKLTPLITAAQCGQVSVVKQLLKMGADPTLKSAKGNTALSIAERYAKKGEAYPIIATLISSHLSMLKIIKESDVAETDSVAIKLAKCFKTYAHPPLLSLHWRSHRKLANSIAKTLSENNQWSAEECNQYIKNVIQDKKVMLNNSGTFTEVMHCANALIDQHLHREDISQPVAEKQQAMK